ncbi:biotin/lipoate A/B protein ligase [Rhodopirellula maiorica SM1]|uniref:Biotin/lipoate A/B protein ligase n=1 Tax=Rhodopirellula maiorica SM1 TaxID=1265738 RepID=M5RKI4_9BACT|nr:biotin/lipoate A/B protein ligase [Rhodopirellula maiorica]EMI19828.1 biotin/lipoate A/B protein ligase [Rhodopirellula maiorica SM1]
MNALQARLIELAAAGPAENMAIDQALLESVDRDAVPTLRFYTWSEPTVSLGYFQKASDRLAHSPSANCAFVRRGTGGGAIVHHHELTYSFVWPLENVPAGAKSDLYQRIHQAILESLGRFGVSASRYADLGSQAVQTAASDENRCDPFLCFQRRTDEDLVVAGYKVCGSAQRTSRKAVLQHGSILMDVSPHSPELPGVVNLTPRSIAAPELAEVLASNMAEAFGMKFVKFELDETLTRRSKQIQTTRFGHSDWNEKR